MSVESGLSGKYCGCCGSDLPGAVEAALAALDVGRLDRARALLEKLHEALRHDAPDHERSD